MGKVLNRYKINIFILVLTDFGRSFRGSGSGCLFDPDPDSGKKVRSGSEKLFIGSEQAVLCLFQRSQRLPATAILNIIVKKTIRVPKMHKESHILENIS